MPRPLGAAPGDNPINARVSKRPNIARLTLLAGIVCLAPALDEQAQLLKKSVGRAPMRPTR